MTVREILMASIFTSLTKVDTKNILKVVLLLNEN